MSSYDARGAATYGGLLQQTYAAIIVGCVCLTLLETLRRVPRRRGKGEVVRADPSDTGETRGLAPQDAEGIKALGSRENWTNGYLYMGRCWAAVPSPPHPKWPLLWIWQVLRTPDEVFLQLSGVDATVYTRFLRACFYFTALHTCTTLVIILPIHYVLSPPDVKRSDMNRGSLSSLVSAGREKLLWVNMTMLIWITISWMLILTWFVLGTLQYRAYAARHVPAPSTSTLPSPNQPDSPHLARPVNNTSSFPAGAYTTGTVFPLHPEPAPTRVTSNDDGTGPDYSLRCRTVMVTNIPQNMRTPRMLRWYFGRYLPEPPGSKIPPDAEKNKGKPWRKVIPSRHKKADSLIEVTKPHDGKLHKVNPALAKGQALDPFTHAEAAAREFEMANSKEHAERVDARGMQLIESIVLAPKLSGLADLIKNREKVIEQLEEAHIALAKATMAHVGKEMGRRAREENRKIREGDIRRRKRAREEVQRQGGPSTNGDGEVDDGGGRLGEVRDRLERTWWVVERLVWGKPDRSQEIDQLVNKIGPFVERARLRDADYGVRVWARGVSAWIKLKVEERRTGEPKKGGSNGGASEEESPVGEEGKKRNGTVDESNGYINRDSKDSKSPVSPTSSPPTFPTPMPPHTNGTTAPVHGAAPPPPDAPSASSDDTVWSALHSLPSSSLHRFHPYTRKRSIFLYPLELVGLVAPTALPTIDLSFLRITSIQKRIEEYKSRPLPDAQEKKRRKDDMGRVEEAEETFPSMNGGPYMDPPPNGKSNVIPAASSAFVTFRKWEDARRAARALAHRPGRPLTCIVVMAPQTTDLDWERLAKGKFAAQFLRDWLVGVAIWFFQIFWIFPVSAITGLVSIKTLETVFPPLTGFFQRNPNAQSLITGLVPTLLVAGLGILIPVILFAIGRKAQTEVTFSGLHNNILIRYYKWLIMNIVIFFCIGIAAFQTFLEAFKKQVPDPFELVSRTFPTAAPFYASWFILQTSLQNMMQLGLVGLPLITYAFGVRKASTPRKRKRGTQPRTIDYHYWTPNHLLAMHITMIFGVLNPLVIPFGLIYYSVANVVFRNQLLHVYARRFYEGNGKMITTRILRYSMDGLALSHVVFLAFNLLNYDRARAGISGTMLGVTIILKIWATREFKSRYERLEDAESARLCGDEEPFLAPGERISNEGTRPAATAASPDAPLSLERLNTFQSPSAAMGPSTFSWSPPGFRTLGHKYDVHHIRGDPRRGKHKGKSFSLSRLASRAGSQAEILRPDSPGTSDEASMLVVAPASSRQLGIYDIVQHVGQVPTKIMGLVAGKASQTSIQDGINYLGGRNPTKLVVPKPPLQRWDDTPNGSASYECPYYLDEAPEAIWLPRDPSGPIDLDDTVAMYRLLLSVYKPESSEGLAAKSSADTQIRIGGSLKQYSQSLSVGRPSMLISNSEKSAVVIPVTQSPAESPSETPPRTSSYSSRAARPSMLRVRTASADRLSVTSSWGRRHSISEALEMANMQTPSPRPAVTLPETQGETSAQARVTRQPSLLDIFRARRSGGEGTDAPRPVSMFSFKSAADGGEADASGDKRKSRMPADDIRRALDAAVRAEERRDEARQAREEEAEDRDDKRVESEETGGWKTLKRLVLKSNTE